MSLQGQFWTPRPVRRAWGRQQVILPPAPAEGVDFVFTVPPGFILVPRTVRYHLEVPEGEAEVRPGLQMTDGNGHVVAQVAKAGLLKAKENANYVAMTGFPEGAALVAGNNLWWIPEVVLLPGYTIESVTTAIKGKDKITGIEIFCEQFELDPQHDLAELEGMALRIAELERKVAAGALPVHA